MNNPQTNGYLMALEDQLRAVKVALVNAQRWGNFTPDGRDALDAILPNITAVVRALTEVRALNSHD